MRWPINFVGRSLNKGAKSGCGAQNIPVQPREGGAAEIVELSPGRLLLSSDSCPDLLVKPGALSQSAAGTGCGFVDERAFVLLIKFTNLHFIYLTVLI